MVIMARLLMLGGLCSLAACVPNLGEAPKPRAISSLAAVRSLPDQGGQWPGDGWWKAYGDPQLDRLIDEGLQGSPDVAAAAARLSRAEGVARSAGAALRPNVDATANATAIKGIYSHGLSDDFSLSGWPKIATGSLRGNFDLDLGGRNRARLRAALRDADAARVEQAEARITLSSAIAQAYSDLARLYAERDVAEEALRIQQDTAGLVSDRVRNGIDTEGQRRQAEAAVPAARADLGAIDEQIGITRNQIAALLGQGPDRGLSIVRPTLGALTTLALPSSAGTDLVGRRPDIAAARARVEAQAERIKVAKAAFYPNVSLSAMIGIQALDIGTLASGQLAYATAGPALTLPIFDAGKRNGDYRVARAEYDAAVADYDRTLISALQEVANAVTSRTALTQQAADTRASLADSQRAFEIARLRYRAGLSTYLDVLTAEQALIVARRRDADLTARAFALDVALVRALGGGFTITTASASAGGA
jgi:NodT family efflux transporter outer membrane factor (OMF) lipoprotein